MLLGFPAPSDAAADDDDGALGPPCCTRLNPAYRALAHALLPDGGAALLDHLFSHEALAVPLPQLAAFCVLKLTLLTPLSLTQAVPTGVFLPCAACPGP